MADLKIQTDEKPEMIDLLSSVFEQLLLEVDYMICRKNIYHTVGTVPAFNRKIVEICKFDIPNTYK
jgi:hypothetical protein